MWREPTFASVLVLIASVILSIVSGQIDDAEHQWFTRGPESEHGPIRIDSNAEFASLVSSEGWAGDGSEGDPFIIENLDINGTGHGFCLFVGNTTAHFIVRNCVLKNATYPPQPYYPGVNQLYYFEAALNFYRVENATVSGVRAEGSNYGFHIFMDHGLIEDCTVRDNNVGIRINGNDDGIANCEIINNTYTGILRQSGTDFNVSDCRIKDNGRGMYITGEGSDIVGNQFENQDNDIFFSHTNDCFLSGNQLSKGFFFDYMEKEEFLSLTVLPDNTLGGKPIRFYRNEMPNEIDTTSNLIFFINISDIELNGIEIDSPASPLNFIYCDGMTISNSNFSSASGPCLNISSTFNLTLKDCSFHDSPVGISAFGMDNVIVEGCRAWNCGVGMEVGTDGHSDRLIVSNCSAWDNDIAGMVVSQLSGQATCVVEENEAWNNGIGILYDSRKGGDFGEEGYGLDTIRNNTLRDNGGIGLLFNLKHSRYKTVVENNTMIGNSVGVNITDHSGSSGVFLSSNIISGNEKDGLTGIWANGGLFMGEDWFKTGCMINNNTIEDNGWNGLNLSVLKNGGGIFVLNNKIQSNGMSGISIGDSYDGGPNPIIGNSIVDNGGVGIELIDLKNGGGPYNLIEDNEISGNRGAGSLSHQYYPDLPIVGGISIISDRSSGYRIRNNTIINNIGRGLFKGEDWSGSGNISGNIIKGNEGDGIIIEASKAGDRSILNNSIIGNTGSGIVFGGGINGYVTNGNTISRNAVGITLRHSNDTAFSKNIVTDNGIGILSEWGDNATIHQNNLSENVGYGVQIRNGNQSTIWENSFFRNNGATDSYDGDHRQACDNGSGNVWYAGTTGNYWDDWRNISGGDVRTDPYPVDCGAGSVDLYPLADPPFLGPSNVTEPWLRGKVFKEGGGPLYGVTVTITELATGKSVDLVTDEDGNFSRTLRPGQYKVELSKKGYEPKEIELDMPPRDYDLTAVMKKEENDRPGFSLCLILIIPLLIMVIIMVLVALLFIGHRSRKVPEE
ncbi:MAG: right-handed parallel beta-helix repeat-containing protein [Candidatus Thermoplasmatota archaeon]|nr:right-handed parallel beta-helix repeat-containing protein [Candidatus Thermoplasmatota archaeon]